MNTYFEISAYESAQDNAPLADRLTATSKRNATRAAALLLKSFPRVEILKQYANESGDLLKFDFVTEYIR